MQLTISRDNWLNMQEYAQKMGANDPQTSFAESIGQTAGSAAKAPGANEVLDKLSDGSIQLLKSMKNGSKNVNYMAWSNLLAELRDTGAITESEYSWAPKGACEYIPDGENAMMCICKGGMTAVPVPPTGVRHCGPGETDIERMLDGLCDWPGDPLEKLETLALYARKWIGMLGVSTDDKGNPGSWYSGAYAEQEKACQNVLKVVKNLMAAV